MLALILRMISAAEKERRRLYNAQYKGDDKFIFFSNCYAENIEEKKKELRSAGVRFFVGEIAVYGEDKVNKLRGAKTVLVRREDRGKLEAITKNQMERISKISKPSVNYKEEHPEFELS